jgi:hypothetical protein
MDAMGQALFEPPNVAGWKNNAYWLGTANVWARANWARYVTWKARDENILDSALGGVPGMTPGAAAAAAFALFHVAFPSPNSMARLAHWLLIQRGDTNAWQDWQFINLLTLTMLSPDMNVA